MDRGQFTFYASFATALRRLKRKNERCDAYDAIVNYALFGEEPEEGTLPDAVMIAFELIRPNLDASRRKAVAVMSRNRKETGKMSVRYEEDSEYKRETETEAETEVETELESEFEFELESKIESEFKIESDTEIQRESDRSIPRPPSAAAVFHSGPDRAHRRSAMPAGP